MLLNSSDPNFTFFTPQATLFLHYCLVTKIVTMPIITMKIYFQIFKYSFKLITWLGWFWEIGKAIREKERDRRWGLP